MSGTTGDLNAVSAVGGEPVGEGVQSPPQPQNALPLTQPQQIPAQATQGQQSVPAQTEQVQQQQQQQKQGVGGEQTATATATTTAPASSPSPSLDEGEPEEEVFTKEDEEACLREYYEIEKSLKDGDLDYLKQFSAETLECTPKHLFMWRSIFPRTVLVVLKKRDPDEDDFEKIGNFFVEMLTAVCRFIELEVPEMMDLVVKIFTTRYPFYNDADPSDTEELLCRLGKVFRKNSGYRNLFRQMALSKTMPLTLFCTILKIIHKAPEDAVSDQLIKKLPEIVKKRIFQLTAEEVRTESKSTISIIIHRFQKILHKCDVEDADRFVDILLLEVARIYFKCPFLEKRLLGLSDIKDIIRRLSSEDKKHRSWITTQYMISWIKDQHIISTLFGNSKHLELIRRCGYIVRFLAQEQQLTLEEIQEIWNSCLGQHETVISAVYSLLEHIAYFLNEEAIQYIYSQFRAIPYSNYTTQAIHFLCDFCCETQDSRFGLDIIWDLVQDTSPVSTDLSLYICEKLGEILKALPLSNSQRIYYLGMLLDNIQNHLSIPQSLYLYRIILEGKHTSPEELTERVQLSISPFFADLPHWKETAQRLPPTSNVETVVSGTKYNLFYHVKERLDFIEFICKSKYQLDQPQIEIFWDTLVVGATNSQTRGVALEWVQSVYSLVPVRLMEFIFLEKFPLLDFSSLTKISFDTLCFLFSAINQQRGLLKRDKGHDANIILSPNLCGFDYLWRALFEASDENVAQTAITFLVRLVEKISLEANQAAQFRLNFVNNCMQKLSCTPIQKLHVERALIVFKRLLQQESRSYKRHALCTRGRLMLLDVKPTGLPPFALSVYQNETLQNLKKKVGEKLEVTPELVRVFNTYGKEFAPSSDSQTLQALCIHSGSLSVAKKEKDLKETPLRPPPPPPPKQEGMFSDVLCQTHFFETMFDLFSLNDDTISKMVWELLNILPTNPHLLEVISTLSEDVHKIMETQPVSKLLYSLTIVVSFTEPSEDPQEVDKRLRWQASFVKHGGITALLNILQSVDFQYGSNCRATLAMLLQIISFFLIDSEGNLRNNIIPVEPKSLQVLVYRLILESAMNSARGDFCSISDDGDVVENGMKLFVACVLHDKSTFTSTIMSQKDFDQWFASVLVEPRDMSIRCASCDGLYKICSGLKTEEVENMFTSKCLALLPSIPHNSKTCDFFFEFLNKLILDKCKAGQKPSNFVQQLLSWLDSHPMIEDKDLMQQDYFAPGLLKLLTTILSFSPEMKAPLGVTLIPTLFTKYLFDVPTINNHGPQRPPFFKSKSARFQAFASLVELCNQCPTNLSQILALLSPHHIHDDRRNFWNYYPSSNEISRCGFVGLKNQGATCYMNSLLQQLYMVPQFRNSILKAEIPALPSPSEKLEDNPLYHLQRIFGELQASERRSVDTKDFCASFKTNGSPINTHVQMDADEFFAQLCDKLEGLLKSANQATILQDCLGGVVCHQVVSRECSHVSQREEGFVTLSLVLQGKKNLEESLYSLIEGDLLDGDNKYHCESCGTKVAARKRCCLSQLPKTLVIHSKRFEFDLEQMRRIKLNDLYEFPMKLNLEPFTKEGLASREGTPTQAKPMSQCYDYELVGVLIHTGTADCGHYYSFIRERVSCNPNEEPRWFQFNDASVDEISPEVIPNSCFGGEEDTQVWDAKASQWVWKQVLKPNNAYMLFYSRVDVNHSDFPILPENIPSPIYTSVWEDNMRFFMERNIFDRDYFIFLWSLVRLIEKEPPELEFGESSTLSHSTLKLAAQFIFDTLSRARERGSFLEYSLNLGQLFEKHIPSCTWFMDYMLTDNMRWPKQILLECPCEDVRIPVVSLFITVIKHLNPHIHHLQWIYDTAVEPMNTDGVDSEKLLLSPPLPGVPKSLIIRFMDKLLSLLPTVAEYWRHFAQYFLMFLRFAQLGADECQYLFSRNVIVQFVDFYMGDESPYSPKSEKRPSMGDKATPPNISHVLDLMEYLLKQMREISTYSVSDLDKEALRYNEFYEKAMRENQNPEAIASIVTILGENQTFSKGIILAVKRGLDELKAERFPPFYTALTALLKINDGDQLTRTSRAYKALCYVIDRNIKYPTETASVLTFLGNKELPHLRAQVWEHFVDLGNPGYLVGNKVSVCEATCSLLQSFVSESLPDSELDSLVEHLVSFFKDEKNFEYGKDSHPRQFVPFLTLLQLSLRGDSQKKIFLEHIDEFYPILISIVTVNMECDESKRSMLDLWHSLLHSCGEILSDFLSKPQHWRALFDVWICFRNDKFLNEYNKIATPSVYRCMLLCSQSNDQFLTDLGNNPNFSWAVDHFLLENWPLFTESQKAIHTILSYGCSHKDVGPVYRCLIRNRIAALKSVVEGTAHHVIQLLDYATLSTEDTYELLKAPKLMRFLFQALGSILGNSKYREQYASTGLTLATNALSLVLENPSSLTATQQEQLVVELGHVMEFFVIKWVEWAAIPLASDMKLSSCFTETLFKWQNLKFLAVAVPQLKKQTQSLLPKRESTPLTYTIAVLAAQYGVSSTREASNPNLITDSIELALNVVMLCPTDTQCSTLLLSAYEHDSTSPLVLSCLSRRPDFLVDCLVHPSFQLKPPLLPFLERIFPQVCASLDLPHLSIILDTLAFQVREVVSTATTVYPSLPKLLAALLVVLQHPQTRDLLLKQVDTAVLLSLTTEETAVRLNLQFNDYRNLGTKLAQVLQL